MRKPLLTITILSLLSCCSLAFAAAPTLYFSDLTDGPKTGWNGSATQGAAVTIWGKNFGSSRGTSHVTVGGVNLTNGSDYAEWGVSTNNARGMERITFWLNNNCANGAGIISVTVGGVTSNTAPFYVRTTGNIRFVDHTNGLNTNNGQADTAAWKTLGKARTSMIGGDIVYIRAGTYDEIDADNRLLLLTGGIAGSNNNYTAFIGYPGELPVLDAIPTRVGFAVRNNFLYNGDPHHIVISKIKVLPYLDAVGASQTSGYYRLIAIEIDGQNGAYPAASTWAGAIDFHDQSHAWIYGCQLYQWGRDKFDHFFYLGEDTNATDVTDYDVGWNECHDLGVETSGIYIHPQDTDSGNHYADNIKIHDNLTYNMTHSGIILNSRYINVYIYNNLLYHCGSAAYGRGALYLNGTNTVRNISNVRVYNNIIHSADASGLIAFLTNTGVSFINNIIYSENNQPYYVDSNYNGTRSSDYNVWYGRGARPAWATGTNDLNNTDPLVTSLVTHDFHLLASSPARDAGADLSATVLSDYDGNARPQNIIYDIGALEYVSGQTNNSPVLNLIGNKTAAENSVLTFTLSATDADGDTLTYSASGLPVGASFNAATHVFSWTPTYTQAGSYNVTFSVNDGNSGTASETITITVSNVNRDPVLGAIGSKSVVENSNLTFTLSATDPDGDTLTYSASNLPTGAAFNTSTGVFSWTPGLAQAGSYPGVRFTVTDGNLSDSEDIAITVTNTNTPPVLAPIGAKSIAEGAVLTFTLSASDADGDSLTYSSSNLPTGATFNASTGVFSWTPGYDQAATYSGVRFSVSDGNLTDSEDIAITVTNTNRQPALAAIGNKAVVENSALTFTVTAADADGDSLTYSASGLPIGAAFNASTRTFSWTPGQNQAGSYAVTFYATDTNNALDSEIVTITVILESEDTQPPYVEGMNPDSDEVQVPLDANITFHIKDKNKGVDINTFSLSVQREGDSAPTDIVLNGENQLSAYPNSVTIQGTALDYVISYDPPKVSTYQFRYEQVVTVNISASDLAANSMGAYSYSFTTAMMLRGKNLKVGKRK